MSLNCCHAEYMAREFCLKLRELHVSFVTQLLLVVILCSAESSVRLVLCRELGNYRFPIQSFQG